jgi:hypothetical protein
MGRSGICAGRHCCDIGGEEDEESSGRRTRPIGANPSDDWYWRRQNGFHDLTHGVDQTAWRVQSKNYGTSANLAGVFDSFLNVSCANGMDDVVQINLNDYGSRRHCLCPSERCGTGEKKRQIA